MIELLHDPSRPHSNEVADALGAMTVAHRVTADSAGFPVGVEAPAIRDGDRVVTGRDDIARYLRELRSFLDEWGRFQGDTCYIGDDGCVI